MSDYKSRPLPLAEPIVNILIIVRKEGRIINANSPFTRPCRFMLHGIHLKTEDQKIINAIQARINSYIKPCTNGD